MLKAKELEGNITNKEIELFNNKSNLPIKLLSESMNEIKNNKIEIKSEVNNYMSHDVNCGDFMFRLSGYPTDEDSYKLTDISLKTSNYDFLGIKCGMDKETALKVLEDNGFNLCENKSLNYINYSNTDKVLVYNNKNCKIAITIEDNIICTIDISLITKYLGNRLY